MNASIPHRRSSRRTGFRLAVLRGLGVVLPPLLTIVVLIWAWNTIESYVLSPVESGIRHAIVWAFEDTIPGPAPPKGAKRIAGVAGFSYNGQSYVPVQNARWYLPEHVKILVDERAEYFGPETPPPTTANAYYHRYYQLWMPRSVVVPVFLIVFTSVLYFLGRLFTFGMGRWFVQAFHRAMASIPVVNKVYGSVKQVTDFAFSEREIEFNRVVAIQYPSGGIWSLGFVTGNSLREISEATGEPMLSVLMPTSPMPMTGFTVTVKRSEAIDLNLTVDEAIQFIVSCGVVVPSQQQIDKLIDARAASARPPNLTAGGDARSGSSPQTQT